MIRISKIDGTRKYLFRSGGRQCDRERVDAVPSRQFRVHLLPGGLPHGLPFLRLHPGRSGAEPDGRRRCWTRFTGFRRITGERVSNVVVMGSGEPMDNYDNVVRFMRLVSHEKGSEYQPEEPHGLHLRHCAGDPPSGGGGTCRSPWRCPSTRPTTRCDRTLMPIANTLQLKGCAGGLPIIIMRRQARRLTFEYSLVRRSQ